MYYGYAPPLPPTPPSPTQPPSPPPSPKRPPAVEKQDIVLPAPDLEPCMVTTVPDGTESPTGPSQVVTKPGFRDIDVFACGSDDGSVNSLDLDRSPDNSFDGGTATSGVPVSTPHTASTRHYKSATFEYTRSMTHARTKRPRTTRRTTCHTADTPHTTSTKHYTSATFEYTRSMTHARTKRPRTTRRTTRSTAYNSTTCTQPQTTRPAVDASTTCTQPLPCMRTPYTGEHTSYQSCGQPQAQGKAQKSCRSCGRAETRQQQKEGREEVIPLLSIPGGQWLPARSTIYNKTPTMLNNRTTLNSNKHPNQTSSNLLPSETKGLRLLQAIVTYRDAHGVTRSGRVKLDTCSNGCYALPQGSLSRPWRPWEPRSVQGIEGTLTPLGNPTYFTLYKNGTPVTVDTNDPPPGALPDGCIALLGLDAIHDLGIDIAHAIKHNRHMPIRYISDQEHLVKNRKTDAINKYVNLGYVQETIVKTCNLSEKVVREYLVYHPKDYASKDIKVEDVEISPSLSRKTREKIREICLLYDMVFANKTNTLPPVLTGVEPHMFKLKEGAKPVRETRPAFPPAKATVITEWLQWALKTGLVEKATNTSYASRLILAPKFKGSTPKSALPDGIRVAWAGVRVNDTILKTVPTCTDAWKQLHKVANTK